VSSRPPALWRTILGNLRVGLTAGVLAGMVATLSDAIITIMRARGHLPVGVILRLLPTSLTLGLIMGGLLGVGQGVMLAITLGRRPARWLTELVDGDGDGDASLAGDGDETTAFVHDDPRPRYWAITPYLWAGALWIAGFMFLVPRLMRSNMRRFNARELIAGRSAVQALVAAIALTLLAVLVVRAARLLGRLLRRMDTANPFASPGAALFVLLFPVVAVGGIVLYVVGAKASQASSLAALRQSFPPQLTGYVVALVILDLAALRLLAGGHSLIPARFASRRKPILAGSAAAITLLAVASLLWWGGHQRVKILTEIGSPAMQTAVGLVHKLTDFDHDGVGMLLGENDCKPFNKHVHPGAVDIPDNGVDENCWGGDLSAKTLTLPPGQSAPVPPEFRRPYNVLLITIDTVRFDHTGMGGYKDRTGRDTTPNLDRLAAESVVFNDVHAPSAGTMASMPAILTSKFFHSGIALGPDRPHKGPLILPENRLIGEVMKDAGYRTGAIVNHDYFVDWGTDQGIDDYDQDIASGPRDPYLVTSHTVTDKALAWIAANAGRKWFLWAHYLDPHGRYVAHPDKSFGNTEEDIYDGELYFTDKHIGRLLDSMRKNPGLWANTLIIVTSDHGDGFNEHGIINHAVALYREIISVPLIIRVPELSPRISDQLATPLDVLPTIAELVGAPIGRRVEGMSLVGPIFYGKTDPARVVFSETNLPVPQRAAITKDWKLIGNIRSNTYQLFDRRADPWEKNNLYSTSPAAARDMQHKLQEWLDRLFFARDEQSNQSFRQARANFVDAVPASAHKVAATWMDAIELVGWESSPPPPWPKDAKPVITVYFRSLRTVAESLRLELMVSGDHPIGPDGKPQNYWPSSSASIVFGGGFAATSSWRPGDIVRESLPLEIRPDFPLTWADLRLRLTDDASATHTVQPKAGALVNDWVPLGTITLGAGKPGTPAVVLPASMPAPGSPGGAAPSTGPAPSALPTPPLPAKVAPKVAPPTLVTPKKGIGAKRPR